MKRSFLFILTGAVLGMVVVGSGYLVLDGLNQAMAPPFTMGEPVQGSAHGMTRITGLVTAAAIGFLCGGCIAGLVAAKSGWSPPTDHFPVRLLVLLQLLLVVAMMGSACNPLLGRASRVMAYSTLVLNVMIVNIARMHRLTYPQWLGAVGCIGLLLLQAAAAVLKALFGSVQDPVPATILIFGIPFSFAAGWLLLRQQRQMPPRP